MESARRRILFVDDDIDVLDGIRRCLRKMPAAWELEFQSTGAQALATLDEQPYDVIVGDLHLPGMSGVELMTQVAERHPGVIRIVLSASVDEAAILRTVEPTHQYLTKPCDPDALKSTIRRACTLRSLLSDESLTQLVTKVGSLPSLPSVYSEVTAALRSEDSSLERIGELIGQDVAMTAKVLKVINSAYFGLPRKVESPAQAASILGVELLKSLVLSAGVFSQFQRANLGCFDLDEFERHSVAVGQTARAICAAEGADKQTASDAGLAGFMHDVGKLVLVQSLPEEYEQVAAVARETSVPLEIAERNTLGASHAEVGAYLLGLWGLSDSIVEAIAFHHMPSNWPDTDFSVLTAIHAADALVHESNHPELTSRLDMSYLEQAGLAARVDTWRSVVAAAPEETPVG